MAHLNRHGARMLPARGAPRITLTSPLLCLCPLAAALTAMAWAAGCGGHQSVKRSPAQGYEPAMAENPMFFAASSYPPANLTEVKAFGVFAEILDQLHLDRPAMDPLLTVMGRELSRFAAMEGDTQRTPIDLVWFVGQRAGVPDNEIAFHTFAYLGSLDPLRFTEDLRQVLLTLTSDRSPNLAGAGEFYDADKNLRYLTVVYTRRPVTFDPFPKFVMPGQPFRIAGSAGQTLGQPAAFFTIPGRGTEVMPIRLDAGGRFTIEAELPKAITRCIVEFAMMQGGGRISIATIPIYFSDRPAPAFVTRIPAFDEASMTAAMAESMVFGLINQERRRNNVPELRGGGTYTEIAKAQARFISQNGGSTTVDAELRNAEERLRLRMDNVFVANSINLYGTPLSRLYAELAIRPSARFHILSPGYTHGALGVNIEARGGQNQYGLELFLAAIPDETNPGNLRLWAREMINAQRTNRGLPAMRDAPAAFSQLLETTAAEAMARPDDKRRIDKRMTQQLKNLVREAKAHSVSRGSFALFSKADNTIPGPHLRALLDPKRTHLALAAVANTKADHPMRGYLIYFVSMTLPQTPTQP